MVSIGKGRLVVRTEIRPTEDLQSVRRLCLECGLEDGSFQDTVSAFGCYKGRELVGCAVLKGREGLFSVDWLAVHEAYRGMGIGSMLVKHVEGEARGRGAETLWVLARAPAFFRGIGYGEGGTPNQGPSMTNCAQCPQYVSGGCRPEILSKKL